MDLARFRVLTFDCYGTLIDWEAGILRALRSVLEPRGIAPPDDQLLALFGEIESPLQEGLFRRYREVLDETMGQLARRLGFDPTPAERTTLSRSLPDWPPFPDTVKALAALARRYDLGIISNVDDDLFAASARHLGAQFKWVVTAERVRSYKPSRRNFHQALARIGLPQDQILHVAQSLYHDIEPARSLGLATVWVNRRAGREGFGATPASTAEPDLTVPDLAALVDLLP
jgi:2-haloacid dehalogenase